MISAKTLLKSILFKYTQNKTIKMRIENQIAEDGALIEMHKSEWTQLSAEQKKKYKKEAPTYTVFKNLSEQFEKYPDYYVTNSKYYTEILPRLSPDGRSAAGIPTDNIFSDKNYFEKFFPDIRFPKAVIHCINGNYYNSKYEKIPFEKAVGLLKDYSAVVFKKSTDTEHGQGVKLVEAEDAEKELKSFGKNFIVQELIKQHGNLSYYNSSSVNIIRIITAYWKGESYFLESRFRIGAPGSFCDHLGFDSVNPLEIAVDEDGNLKGKPFDEDGGKFVDSIFGKDAKYPIPNYRELIAIALKGQAEYPRFGMLGWDFTIGDNGQPICVEVNSKWPSIRSAQCVNGPFFMKKTKDGNCLLDEIMASPIPYDKMKII